MFEQTLIPSIIALCLNLLLGGFHAYLAATSWSLLRHAAISPRHLPPFAVTGLLFSVLAVVRYLLTIILPLGAPYARSETEALVLAIWGFVWIELALAFRTVHEGIWLQSTAEKNDRYQCRVTGVRWNRRKRVFSRVHWVGVLTAVLGIILTPIVVTSDWTVSISGLENPFWFVMVAFCVTQAMLVIFETRVVWRLVREEALGGGKRQPEPPNIEIWTPQSSVEIQSGSSPSVVSRPPMLSIHSPSLSTSRSSSSECPSCLSTPVPLLKKSVPHGPGIQSLARIPSDASTARRVNLALSLLAGLLLLTYALCLLSIPFVRRRKDPWRVYFEVVMGCVLPPVLGTRAVMMAKFL